MKVSVIVPVYNTKDNLDKCIESLVNQSLKEIEVIIINDGSTEDISSIINKYKDKIVYIENTNHGIGYTRNQGIKKAKGEFIGFVDSDDFVHKDMYKDMYNYAIKEKLDIACCNYARLENNLLKEIKSKSFMPSSIQDNKRILVDISYGPCNKIYNRKMIMDNNINFEEKLKYEDFPFVFKSILRAKKIGLIEMAYYYYVIRENSETTTIDRRDFDIFRIMNIIIDYSKDKEIDLELEYIIVYKLLDYNMLKRASLNSKLRKEFINKTFSFINKNFPNYKSNVYIKKESVLKKIIKQNRIIILIYCFLYPKK